MLKPLSSRYNDQRRGAKWIKLKKDFIPGAGDTLDFHLVGASYSIKRARELFGGPWDLSSTGASRRLIDVFVGTVPPSVLTTFFVGLEAPEHGLRRHSVRNNLLPVLAY